MSGRQTIAVLAAVLALAAQASPVRAQSLAYQIKANYLVRFAAFVDWPPAAFAAPDAPLTLCVAGQDPFGRSLDQAAASQTAHGRRIVIRRLGRAAVTGCHIVYLGRDAASLPDADRPVLTVSDAAVAGRRATIHFVIVDNRVRFEINRTAAARAGLGVSSRLLNLAVDVQEPVR